MTTTVGRRQGGASRHRNLSPWLWIAASIVSCVLPSILAPSAHGGLSPENVVVVVNADDPVSVRIADQYMVGRAIPAGHRIELTGIPDKLQITLAQFKSLILLPLIEQLDRRRLSGTVHCVAYSSGFPTSVDVTPHRKQLPPAVVKYNRPIASLTGLTFLYQYILADRPEYLGNVSNHYARGPFSRHLRNPFFEDELRERFDDIRRSSRQPDIAAGRWDELSAAHPTIAPLSIRSAMSNAEADNPDAIGPRLTTAIAGGWRSAEFIKDDSNLAPHLTAQHRRRLLDFPIVAQEPTAFDSRLVYGLNGWPLAPVGQPAAGLRYLLSTMLAVIHPRGQTEEEAIEVLQRSATVESKPARGEFWFSTNRDVRSKTRLPAVPAALAWLDWLGVKSSLQPGMMPRRPGRVMGMMLGTATMNFDYRPWHFAPGAMAESLTSTSGAFNTRSQTKITELLREGASITCGAVTEPYTILSKFPQPMTYAYYATGATAAEAIYLGLGNPYQQIIIGDPLVQPYAKPPRHRITFEAVDGICQISISAPAGWTDEDTKLARVDLSIDGVIKRSMPPKRRYKITLPPKIQWKDRMAVTLVGDDMMASRRLVRP